MKNFKILFILISTLISTLGWTGCSERVNLSVLNTVKVYKCDDGTITYDQPEGKSSYEGLCGPVAAANAFHAYCKKHFVDPKLISTKYFSDITPGVRPDSMESGLNEMFSSNSICQKGEWKYYYAENRWRYLDSLYYEVRRGNSNWKRLQKNGKKITRSPVLALIKGSGKNLHWVTVVDVVGYSPKPTMLQLYNYRKDGCKVIYNHYGYQAESSCEDFVSKANQVDDSMYLDIILPEYIHLVFEPT
jgi:hypothetical protein